MKLSLHVNIGGAALHSTLAKQKEFFKDNVEIASSVARIHEFNFEAEHWPGIVNKLTSLQAAQQVKEAANYVNTVIRSSCALISLEKGLEPLKDAINTMQTDIETMVKDRNAQVIDYDSYRRRVKTIKEKKDTLEVTIKPNYYFLIYQSNIFS
jgi:hypothetical protein